MSETHSYLPQVLFGDEGLDEQNHYYRIPNTESGYAAMYLYFDIDKKEWWLCMVSDEYSPGRVRLDDITKQKLEIYESLSAQGLI